MHREENKESSDSSLDSESDISQEAPCKSAVQLCLVSATKNKIQRFITLFQDMKNQEIEKKRFIMENSESQNPNKDLLTYIEQVKRVDPTKVYRDLKLELKEKKWQKKLQIVFVNPDSWAK